MEFLFTTLLLISLGAVIILLPKYIQYQRSEYGNESGNSFFETVAGRGVYGEFVTFRYLEKLEGSYKLMSNLYIPRKNGTTTEVDLLMIAKTGIYVFESKNYSGWISGDERYKNWTQALENKRKKKFFNPIWQNEAHINALKYVLPQPQVDDRELYKSMIVFSERCTLKKVDFTSPHVEVLKRNDLVKWMKVDLAHAPSLLSNFEMNKIYYTLKKYACVDDSVKQAHIESLKLRKIK